MDAVRCSHCPGAATQFHGPPGGLIPTCDDHAEAVMLELVEALSMSLDPVEVPRDVDFESILLHKLRVQVSKTISDEFAESVESSTWRDDVLGETVWALRGVVVGERLAEKEVTVVTKGYATFRFPTSPWQYFKQRHVTAWWMRWFVRRWPPRLDASRSEVVRSKRVLVEQFATFPMSPIRTPEKYRGDHVVRYDRVTVSDR